jgi:hypothetical protein
LVEYKSFLYQAASWKRARRVVAKVEHHQSGLLPRVGFVVTNLSLPSRAVVRFPSKRGTAEQWIKEDKQSVKTGGRLVKHARYYWLLLAEGHLTRPVFAAILRGIWALPLPVG